MNEQKRTRFVSAVPVEEPMILGEIRVFRGPSAAFPPVGKQGHHILPVYTELKGPSRQLKKGNDQSDSLGGIADMLLEHDPRLFAIIRENEDIDPVGMGGRREVEDGADLQKV